MIAVLVFIALIFLLGYFENKTRWKENAEDFDRFLGKLDKMVDTKLDEAIEKAEDIA